MFQIYFKVICGPIGTCVANEEEVKEYEETDFELTGHISSYSDDYQRLRTSPSRPLSLR